MKDEDHGDLSGSHRCLESRGARWRGVPARASSASAPASTIAAPAASRRSQPGLPGLAGIAVAREVNGLAEVGDTVAEVGRSTTTVGETLRALPIVGGSLAEAADQIAQAGRDAVTSTREPSLGLTSCRRGERSCTYR